MPAAPPRIARGDELTLAARVVDVRAEVTDDTVPRRTRESVAAELLRYAAALTFARRQGHVVVEWLSPGA